MENECINAIYVIRYRMYGRNRRSPSPDRSGRSGKYQILIKNIAFEIDWKHLKDVIKV